MCASMTQITGVYRVEAKRSTGITCINQFLSIASLYSFVNISIYFCCLVAFIKSFRLLLRIWFFEFFGSKPQNPNELFPCFIFVFNISFLNFFLIFFVGIFVAFRFVYCIIFHFASYLLFFELFLAIIFWGRTQVLNRFVFCLHIFQYVFNGKTSAPKL